MNLGLVFSATEHTEKTFNAPACGTTQRFQALYPGERVGARAQTGEGSFRSAPKTMHQDSPLSFGNRCTTPENCFGANRRCPRETRGPKNQSSSSGLHIGAVRSYIDSDLECQWMS